MFEILWNSNFSLTAYGKYVPSIFDYSIRDDRVKHHNETNKNLSGYAISSSRNIRGARAIELSSSCATTLHTRTV